jgi:hypothetical protein
MSGETGMRAAPKITLIEIMALRAALAALRPARRQLNRAYVDSMRHPILGAALRWARLGACRGVRVLMTHAMTRDGC